MCPCVDGIHNAHGGSASLYEFNRGALQERQAAEADLTYGISMLCLACMSKIPKHPIRVQVTFNVAQGDCGCMRMCVMGLQVLVPPLAQDLIQRLLCDVDDRLGTHGGAAEIMV